MNSLLKSFDTEANFWHLNPQFKAVGLFNSMFEKDESVEHKDSSKMMWAIALFADYDSIYQNIDKPDREKIIQSDYMKNKSFTIKKFAEEIDLYITLTYTQARKSLRNFEDKLKERDTFIESKKYSEDTYEMLDDMLKTTKPLYDEYERLKKIVASESASDTLRGGGEQSLTDSGVI